MVFFTCGGCNETLKKNKVDQHFDSRCKSVDYVSCVDCSKDFYGKLKLSLKTINWEEGRE